MVKEEEEGVGGRGVTVTMLLCRIVPILLQSALDCKEDKKKKKKAARFALERNGERKESDIKRRLLQLSLSLPE